MFDKPEMTGLSFMTNQNYDYHKYLYKIKFRGNLQ